MLPTIFFFLSWQCGVWETLLTALEILIRVHHPHQVFNIRQFLKAEVVHHFLLTCQVLQVHHHPTAQRDIPQILIVFQTSQGASGQASDCHPTGSVPVIRQNHPGGARVSSRHGSAKADLQLPACCSPSNKHLRLPHSSQFLLLTAPRWGARLPDLYQSAVSYCFSCFKWSCLVDGKLYQEKVQSIMYLRHSSSGGKSASSSVVSLSPTAFNDAPNEGTLKTGALCKVFFWLLKEISMHPYYKSILVNSTKRMNFHWCLQPGILSSHSCRQTQKPSIRWSASKDSIHKTAPLIVFPRWSSLLVWSWLLLWSFSILFPGCQPPSVCCSFSSF